MKDLRWEGRLNTWKAGYITLYDAEIDDKIIRKVKIKEMKSK